jgi:hypothetical protein
MGAALAGFGYVTGWPDRAPAAPFVAYTDYVSPRFALAALLAALDHRDRTGEGTQSSMVSFNDPPPAWSNPKPVLFCRAGEQTISFHPDGKKRSILRPRKIWSTHFLPFGCPKA